MKRIITLIILLIFMITGCKLINKKEINPKDKEIATTTTTSDNNLSRNNFNIKLNAIANSPDGTIVGCGDNGILSITKDLVSWEHITLEKGSNFYDIAYYNDSFVVLGADIELKQKVLYRYSLDNKEISWQTLDWNVNMLKVANNKIFLLGINELVVSPDLINWEQVVMKDEKSQGDIYYDTIHFNGDLYITTGGGGFIATSADLKEWKFINEPQPGSLTSYGSTVMNKITVAVGDHLWIAASPDGKDWFTPYPEEDLEEKKINIKNKEEIPDYETLCLLDVTNNGEEFVAVGHRGLVLASKDGVSWVVKPKEINTEITDILWNGEYFVVLCEDGVFYSLDAEKWEECQP